MDKSIDRFDGFSRETLDFFKEFKINNDVHWFEKNRTRYEEYLIKLAKSFTVSREPCSAYSCFAIVPLITV